MSLSENIKRLRLEKGMTQEQLATKLGVSAQAVSKWETSETYPDGALLLPLAEELQASLDELFDNTKVSMDDISKRIIKLFSETEEKDRFPLARDIGWQIEKGLFHCKMQIEDKYSPNEILQQTNSSYILDDYGFTLISNGKEPFFSVFPEPEEGFGCFLEDIDDLQKIFAALSSPDTMTALLYLLKREDNYAFEPALLIKECNIHEKELDKVISNLMLLNAIWRQNITIDGKSQTLCYSRPSHKWIALFLVAREVGYKGAYSLQSHYRTKPFLKTIDSL